MALFLKVQTEVPPVIFTRINAGVAAGTVPMISTDILPAIPPDVVPSEIVRNK